MNRINRVGVLTWHYYQNFGSALQCFAIQTLLENLGKEVKVINYRNPNFGSVDMNKERLCYLLAPVLERISPRFKLANLRFRKKYIHETRLVMSHEAVWKIAQSYDAVVFGSDQIWAPNLLNPIYLGESIPDSIRKVSYAASIGLNAIPKELVPMYQKWLHSFYAVSIREEEGKSLLKKECNIESTVVLDPTLMEDVSVYRKMQREVIGIQRPFLFCYFLNKKHKYKDIVQKYAREHNLQIVAVSDKPEDAEWTTRLTGLGADHFLWLINNSETIMTDSYHGTIFSLLFHKNLWLFRRFEEDNPICQNSRIRQLQNDFNIAHRIISTDTVIDESLPIDYQYFERQLSRLRSSSLSFLMNSLR